MRTASPRQPKIATYPASDARHEAEESRGGGKEVDTFEELEPSVEAHKESVMTRKDDVSRDEAISSETMEEPCRQMIRM